MKILKDIEKKRFCLLCCSAALLLSGCGHPKPAFELSAAETETAAGTVTLDLSTDGTGMSALNCLITNRRFMSFQA